MRPHIFLATPCYGGVVTQGYMQSVCALMAAAPAAGVDLTLGLLGQDALITRSRNTLLSCFTHHPEATHILFIDADIIFEPEHVFKLLRFGRPVVAGIYPLKAYYWDAAFQQRIKSGEALDTAGLHYVGQLMPEKHLLRDGDFATALFAGTGFMLIERESIRKMTVAYPETRYRRVDAYRSGNVGNGEAYALFDCIIDQESGTYMSEDFTFCRRWREQGGDVWLDTVAQLAHHGPSDFRGNPAPRFSENAL